MTQALALTWFTFGWMDRATFVVVRYLRTATCVRWRLVSFVAESVNDVQFSSSVISLLDLASVGIKSPLTFVCFVVVVVAIAVNSRFVDMLFPCWRSGSFTVLCFTWWNLYALFGWKLLMTYIHQDFIWPAFA
ncbi:hypothetical protein A2U01_0044167 [Trifolium medium]|uniref:Uncharacterized protein n=1 Tax=Trifolium medium TaxID=97028 RepID=A0A392QGC2_9FABA|nr:hypothetical protein [Trifolium medium]